MKCKYWKEKGLYQCGDKQMVCPKGVYGDCDIIPAKRKPRTRMVKMWISIVPQDSHRRAKQARARRVNHETL